MANTICIYTSRPCNKLRYVLDFVFKEQMKLHYEVFDELKDFEESEASVKLAYGDENVKSDLYIPGGDYFSSFDIANNPVLKKTLEIENRSCDFDVFACIFFLLARVEEYRDHERDIHNRFMLKSSVLYENELYTFPLIDRWIANIREYLESSCGIMTEKKQYSFHSSIDIDHIYAYRAKAIQIRIGSFFKDFVTLRWQRVVDRFKKDDPYDTFEEIVRIHESRSIKLNAFVLCAPLSKFDRTLDHRNPAYVEKIRYLDKHANIGIHPSYRSASDAEMMRSEKENLESVIGKTLSKSRQHYLRMQFPKTMRSLLEIGIREEHSMSFHEAPGFRAGTSQSFFWYDLEADSQSELRIFPFQLMEMSLKKYLNLDTEEAFEKTRELVDRVKALGGDFRLLWHNSSFYEEESWKNWKELYIRILDYAKV